MAPRKKKLAAGQKISEISQAEIHAMLDRALEKRMDFVLVFEGSEPGIFEKMHTMTGRLITPCMFGTLRNRVELQEDEGALYRGFEILP